MSKKEWAHFKGMGFNIELKQMEAEDLSYLVDLLVEEMAARIDKSSGSSPEAGGSIIAQMTNPMTPTEQDKELRQKVQDIFNDCTSGWLITIKNFNGYERELGDMESEIIGDILDLITADRKRVALEEWDIANEAILKDYHVISDEQEELESLVLANPKSHNDRISSYIDRAFGFDLAFQPFAEVRRKRIAELKAQQEANQ